MEVTIEQAKKIIRMMPQTKMVGKKTPPDFLPRDLNSMRILFLDELFSVDSGIQTKDEEASVPWGAKFITRRGNDAKVL